MKPNTSSLVGRSLAACVVLSCAFSACSSDSTQHPSLVDDPGGNSNANAGSISSAGHAGSHASDAGAGGATVGGNGNATGDGGEGAEPPLQVGGSAPMAGPATCSETAKWATAAGVDGVSTAASETLLSVTLDELDLAFLRADVLYVAHRSSPSAAFSTLIPVPLPAGWSAAQGASLSADGKRLILVSDPDQKKLGELTRTARDQAFSADVSEDAFAGVNDDAVYTGRIYASPVVSGGDDQLIFNSGAKEADAGATEAESTVVYSTRTGGGAWSAPRQLQVKVLDGASGARRLPTGLSADQRTLFYFNEETMQEEGRWRASNSASSPLYDVISLGMRRGAAPNTACDHLYSGANGDVVVEKD